ncbi:DMT family transporter [Hymenobacter humi]|uniref:Guanidinium exporter n=1 Tax=Hymenobacter humi TaxID=1411620 RepID=A0ABW2U7Z1_9BACT
MHWLYLLAASLLEVCWTYSLKALNMQKIRDVEWMQSFAQPAHLTPVLPLVAYIGFGLGNVIFLSLAMRNIPTATAYAAWMALAVIGLKIVDVFVLKQSFSMLHLFYTSLIIIGVIGLKRLP